MPHSSLPSAPSTWRRSTRCDSGYCVEVAFHDGQVQVRDAKNVDDGHLTFDPSAWAGFLADLRDGSIATG